MNRLAALVALTGLACGSKTQPGGPAPDHAGSSHERWSIVRALSSDAFEGRAPGTAGSAMARAAIIAELERCGVVAPPALTYEQTTAGPAINVIGHLPGSEAHRYVVLSAHYDHLGVQAGEIMNGADDNAAAVGSVLAVACALASRPRRATLIVAFWDAEEPPHFLSDTMGSRAWVRQPHVPLGEVEAAIVLDLVGGGLWPGSPMHVALGAESSPGLAAAVERTPVPAGLVVGQAGLHLVEELVTGSHQPWSDYHYFRDAGVPTLFLSNGQTQHYHTAGDDFATLDLDKLDRQTTWLTALVGALLDLSVKDAPRHAPVERPDVDRAAARRLVEGALASGHFADVRDALASDLAAIATGDARALRVAVQRVQCFAAKRYPSTLCRMLGGAQ